MIVIRAVRRMDLRLASTYVPAFVCVGKSVVVAVAAVWVVPLGGAPALSLGLLLDRMYCRPNAPGVFDVNAVLAFVFGLCVVVEERHHRGTPIQLALPLLAVWMGLAAAQSWRPLFIGQRLEVVLLSTLAALVSLTHQAEEMLVLFLGRVICLLLVVVLSVYVSSALVGEGPSSALVLLFLLRAGPIMLASLLPGVAFGALLLAIIAGGLYNSKHAAAAFDRETAGMPLNNKTHDPEAGDEDALLREALAKHKGNRSS